MSSITKDQLVFDPAESDNDNVGAFVKSSDGTLIDKVVLSDTVDRLAVAAALVDSDGHELDVNADGSINTTVSATDLDIRDLVNTQDSVAIGDETNLVDMQQVDAAFSLTSWTFPITGVRRDADTSPVSATGDAHPLVFDDEGQLKVRASVVASVEPSDAEFLKGSVAGNTDALIHMGAVRQDTLSGFTGVDDGDYTSLKVDSLGRLWTAAQISGDVADDAADSGNPLKVGSRATDAVLTALSAANDRADNISDLYRRLLVNNSAGIGVESTSEGITDAAGQLVSTPLAGRVKMVLQNIGSKDAYIGGSAVTASGAATDGIILRKRTSIELDVGEHVDVYARCVSTETTTINVLEVA